jgi:hypothetical protein
MKEIDLLISLEKLMEEKKEKSKQVRKKKKRKLLSKLQKNNKVQNHKSCKINKLLKKMHLKFH